MMGALQDFSRMTGRSEVIHMISECDVVKLIVLQDKRDRESYRDGNNCKTVAQYGGMGKLQLKSRLGHGHFTSTLCAIYRRQV